MSERSTVSNVNNDDVCFSVSCAGNFMYPQIMMDEILFVLQGLAKLVLHPLTAMHLSFPSFPSRRSEVRTEQDEHEQEFRSSTSSTLHNVKLKPNLNSERAHLFLLYRLFCELVTTRYDHPLLFRLD